MFWAPKTLCLAFLLVRLEEGCDKGVIVAILEADRPPGGVILLQLWPCLEALEYDTVTVISCPSMCLLIRLSLQLKFGSRSKIRNKSCTAEAVVES